jgi:hypothetical protein
MMINYEKQKKIEKEKSVVVGFVHGPNWSHKTTGLKDIRKTVSIRSHLNLGQGRDHGFIPINYKNSPSFFTKELNSLSILKYN